MTRPAAPIDVRRLGSTDVATLRDIVAMLPPPEWRAEVVPPLAHLARALGDDRVYVFAAFDGGRPAGFASAYRFPSLTFAHDLAYIYDVFVAEADRGKGIGRRLFDALLDRLKRDGVAAAWVGADHDNGPARGLYATAAEWSEDYVHYEYTFDRTDAAATAPRI